MNDILKKKPRKETDLPPTLKEIKVLKFINEYQKCNGFPPTLSQIAKGLKYKSTNSATLFKQSLERKGLITSKENQAKTIRLTEEGREAIQ